MKRPNDDKSPLEARVDNFSLEDQLFTELLAAEVLRLNVRTLRLWRERGGGPPYLKLGRAVRYRRSDLVAWLDQQVRRSTSDPARSLVR